METVRTDDTTAAPPAAAPPRMTGLLGAAAALFAIAALWQASQVRRLGLENDRLMKQHLALTQQADALSAELEALAAHDTRQIALTGQTGAPAASAKVFLEPSRKRAAVFFHDLPLNGQDKSYQLWILRTDQPQPASAGVFDARKNGRASITIENLPITEAITGLAVTLEPRGGAKQPTSTNYIVSGNVR